MQNLRIPRNEQPVNIENVKVVFNSNDPYFVQAKERLLKEGIPPLDVEKAIIGKYFIQNNSTIKFNKSLENIKENDAEEAILREIIHLAQDLTEKYPEMENHKIKKNRNISSLGKRSLFPNEKT